MSSKIETLKGHKLFACTNERDAYSQKQPAGLFLP